MSSKEKVIPIGSVIEGAKEPAIPIVEKIDFDKLRINQSFALDAGIKRELVVVPVHRPNKKIFIRVHPEWTTVLHILEDDSAPSRPIYLVDNSIESEIRHEIKAVQLYTVITRDGSLHLWQVRVPAQGEAMDTWSQSAHDIAEIAKTQWLRVVPSLEGGYYLPYLATAELPEPTWPDMSFDAILQKAFQGKYIKTLEHAVLRKLRGEA